MATPWSVCEAYLDVACNEAYGEPTGTPLPPATRRYAQLLWVLADGLGARRVLEIGIGPTCVSGVVFAHVLAQSPGGHLVSVDLNTARPRGRYQAAVAALGVSWTVVHGDSLDPATQAQVPTAPVDLLYIDGNHEPAYAYGDTRAYLRWLRPGGLLVIDDSRFPGVVEARRRLEAEGMTFVEVPHDAGPGGNGRLIWQMP